MQVMNTCNPSGGPSEVPVFLTSQVSVVSVASTSTETAATSNPYRQQLSHISHASKQASIIVIGPHAVLCVSCCVGVDLGEAPDNAARCCSRHVLPAWRRRPAHTRGPAQP